MSELDARKYIKDGTILRLNNNIEAYKIGNYSYPQHSVSRSIPKGDKIYIYQPPSKVKFINNNNELCSSYMICFKYDEKPYCAPYKSIIKDNKLLHELLGHERMLTHALYDNFTGRFLYIKKGNNVWKNSAKELKPIISWRELSILLENFINNKIFENHFYPKICDADYDDNHPYNNCYYLSDYIKNLKVVKVNQENDNIIESWDLDNDDDIEIYKKITEKRLTSLYGYAIRDLFCDKIKKQKVTNRYNYFMVIKKDDDNLLEIKQKVKNLKRNNKKVFDNYIYVIVIGLVNYEDAMMIFMSTTNNGGEIITYDEISKAYTYGIEDCITI